MCDKIYYMSITYIEYMYDNMLYIKHITYML